VKRMISTKWTMAALLIAPLLASCTSSGQYQEMLEDKDRQIRQLNEERAALKQRVQELKSNLDSANGELANASARPAEATPIEAKQDEKSIPELDAAGIDYATRDGNLVITLESAITFSSGSATLSESGNKALKSIASTLKSKYGGAKYSIEGHTDDEQIQKSKFASNRELSLARASAVHSYLVVECGVPDGQCVVAGYGEYEPVAKGDSKEARAKNRRVEIVVHKSKT
jgi:chemotaxis protein MotB